LLPLRGRCGQRAARRWRPFTSSFPHRLSVLERILVMLEHSRMAQEIPAFYGAKGLDDARYPALETWNCALGCLSQ
jgi:hypothetical protein